MAGAINSRALGKAAINAAGSGVVAISAALYVSMPVSAKVGKRAPLAADIPFDFDIGGASNRQSATADLNIEFDSIFAASRMKSAIPQALSMSFDIAGKANQRVSGRAGMIVNLETSSKMQFAHLRQAPRARVVSVEVDIRSSTLDKEQG